MRNYTPSIQSFLFFFLSPLLLLSSWYFPYTQQMWNYIDIRGAEFLNSILRFESLQIIVAYLNHAVADWFHDVVIVGFFSYAYIKTGREEKKIVRNRLFFLFFLTVFSIAVVNKSILSDVEILRRNSPSLVLRDHILLHKEVSSIKVKDLSSKSFPSDHGSTGVAFLLSAFFLTTPRFQRFAFSYSFIFFLPRMIVGAHWITDVVMGSYSVISLIFAFAYCTYFRVWILREQHLAGKKNGSSLQTTTYSF